MGQGPTGYVVKYAVVEGCQLLKNGVDDAVLGLSGGHHVGRSLGERLLVERHVLAQLVHLNVVQEQGFEQFVGERGVLGVAENVGLGRKLAGFGESRGEKVALGLQVEGFFFHRAAHGGQARGHVVSDGEGKRNHAVGTFLGQPTRAAHFKGDAHPALKIGVRRAVDGREVVELLLGPVQRAEVVEGFGEVLGHMHIQYLVGRAGDEVVFGAVGLGGLEIVSAVGAHLVKVNHHVRVPFVEEGHAGAAFGVHQREPVAVEVGVEVVGATPGPGLGVLAVERVGHVGPRLVLVEPMAGAVTAIGVFQRVDGHHGLAQPLLGFGVGGGREVVGQQQSRFAAAALVAVHPKVEAHYHGQPGVVGGGAAGVGQAPPLLVNLRQVLLIFGRGDGRHQLRALLVCLANHPRAHPLRQPVQLAQVGHNLVRTGIVRTNGVAQKLLRCRNSRVELRGRSSREKVSALSRGGRGCGQQAQGQQRGGEVRF